MEKSVCESSGALEMRDLSRSGFSLLFLEPFSDFSADFFALGSGLSSLDFLDLGGFSAFYFDLLLDFLSLI